MISNPRTMHPKLLFGDRPLSLALAFAKVACVLALTNCGSENTTRQFPTLDKKNPKNQAACDRVALISGLELSGAFLKNFIECSARYDVTSSEHASESSDTASKMPAILELVNKIDEKGLQALVDFLLQPSPFSAEDAALHGKYPYLHLFSVLLDRGNTDEPENPRFVSLTERYDEMQNLLLALDPYRSAALVLNWHTTPLGPLGTDSQRTQLDLMLDHLNGFLDQLESGTINGLTHQLVSSKEFRQDIVNASLVILGNNDLYKTLEDFFTITTTNPISQSARNSCIQLFQNPTPKGFSRVLSDQCQFSTNSAATDGLQKWQVLVDRIGADRMQGFTKELVKSYLEAKPTKRMQTVAHLSQSLQDFWRADAQPLQTMTYLLRSLKDTKVKDLGFILDEDGVIGQLIGTDKDNAVDTLMVLGTKIGFGSLESDLNHWLVYGDAEDASAYCGEFRHLGLQKQLVEATPEPLIAALNPLLTANPSCTDSLSPLVAKAMSLRNCNQATKPSCFTELTPSQLNRQFIDPHDIAGDDLRNLLWTSFELAKATVTTDSYALMRKGINHGSLSIAELDALYALIVTKMDARHDSWTLEDLAIVSNEIDEHPEFRKRFRSGAIESLMDEAIAAALRHLFDFRDIFSDVSANNTETKRQQFRINRLLWGVYEGGPVASLLSDVLKPELWPELEDLRQSGFEHSALELLSRYRDAASAFQSPLFLKGIDSFRHSGNDDSLTDSTIIRKPPFAPKIQTNITTGKFSADLSSVKLHEAKALLDWDQHPLRLDHIRSVRVDVDFVQNLQTPLGSEDWHSKLLETPCTEDRQDLCPLNSTTAEQWTNRELLWSPNLLTNLLRSDVAIHARELRRLLFYASRTFGVPVNAYAESLLATANVTTRQNNRFNSFATDLAGFHGYPWPNTLQYFPESVLNGQLGRFFDPSQFAKFTDDFASVNIDERGFTQVPESVRALGHLGLLTATYKPILTLAPMIGFGKSGACVVTTATSNGGVQFEPTACPLTLPESTPDSTPQYHKESYADWLSMTYAAQLCPYLADPQDLPVGLSAVDESLAQWLREHTQWQDVSVCKNPLVVDTMVRTLKGTNRESLKTLPPSFFAWVLKDINALGRNPQPLAGLTSATFRLRFYKESQKQAPRMADVLEHSPFLGATESAWARAFSEDSRMLPYRPSLVDAYVATVAAVASDGKWDRSSDTWKVLFKDVIDLSSTDQFRQSRLIHFLEERIKNANRDPRRSSMSLLEFLVSELNYLGCDSPQARNDLEMISYLLASPFGHRALEVHSTINTALTPGYLKYFEGKGVSTWESDPSLKLIKLFSTRHLTQSVAFLLRAFNADEIQEAIKLAATLLHHLGTTSEEQTYALELMIRVLEVNAFSVDLKGDPQFLNWQNLIGQILESLPLQKEFIHLDAILSKLTSPVQTFGGKSVGGVLSLEHPNLDRIIGYSIKQLPQLMNDYQRSLVTEPGYLRQMLLGLLNPLIRRGTQDHEFATLKRYLQEPIFGLKGDNFILEPLLNDRRYVLYNLLTSVQKASATDWLNASRESETLLMDSYRFINFVHKKIRFHDPTEAIDFERTLKAMSRLTSPHENGLQLNRQLQLLERWFEAHDHLKDLRGTEASEGSSD